MITAYYSKQINAPKAKVYKTMLDKPTYELWTKEFNASSSFDGSWEKGSKIYFTGVNKEGKREGMVSEIIENTPNEIVSISHKGVLDGDKEITEGPEVEKWANFVETYKFQEDKGITTVSIEQDMDENYKNYFNDAWERALNKLKQLCEK